MVEQVSANGTRSGPDSRKPGYYSSALRGELLVYYEEALGIEGLDQEIALLSAIIAAAARDPQRYHSLVPGLALLSRLVSDRRNAGCGERDRLQATRRNGP